MGPATRLETLAEEDESRQSNQALFKILQKTIPPRPASGNQNASSGSRQQSWEPPAEAAQMFFQDCSKEDKFSLANAEEELKFWQVRVAKERERRIQAEAEVKRAQVLLKQQQIATGR